MVSADGPATLVQAMRHIAPQSRTALYWAARLTLVNRAEDLAAFDAVFDAIFADAVSDVGSNPRTAGPVRPPLRRQASADVTAAAATATACRGPRCPPSISAAEFSDGGIAVPDAAAQPAGRAGPTSRSIGSTRTTCAASAPGWSSCLRAGRGGAACAGRCIAAASESTCGSRCGRRGTTGWEVVRLRAPAGADRPRRVVLVCDVSRSMRPYATIYLHLMRAAALRQKGIRPEVFAFSTSLTRLTPALSHRSAEVALSRANAKVVDRYGGTHLGRSVGGLLAAPHGSTLRGAVVIIASDGWDSDPPEVLERALARVRRRAHMVVWLNPRAAQPGFEPLAGSMAAALPYCDLFLPAHSLSGLRDLFAALGGRATPRPVSPRRLSVDAPASPGRPR